MKYIYFSFLVLVTTLVSAQWDVNVSINTPVAVTLKSQANIHTVTDTKNGAIITWDDNRNFSTNSTDIYAQRMSNIGVAKWATNGVAVCSNTAIQKSVAIIDAGNGSSIITWEDYRAGNYDIYAQKLDSMGNALWANNGVVVCSKALNQKNPKISSDSAGGAIILWEDSLNFYWDVTAQHISSAGVTLWPLNGVTICNAVNDQINPKIDIDGLGGVVIVWQDKRNSIDYDIYAQRINSIGIVQWTANGTLICNAANSQTGARIEPDGANGALIAWVDKRNGLDYDVYAQRISATGNVQWVNNGALICNAVNNQSAIDIKYIGSGLMVAWKDSRTSFDAIYVQKISLTGAVQMATNGALLSNSIKALNPNVVSDAFGGVIVAWQDSTTTGWDITSQKINSSGVLQWIVGGISVCNATNNQIKVAQVSDGNGGAIYAWEDYRSTTDYDVYAQHLYSDGATNVGIKEDTRNNDFSVSCYPNPITSNSIIQLKNNNFNKNYTISIYNSFGKLVQTKILTNTNTYPLTPSDFDGDIYFYYILFNDKKHSVKGSFIVSN